MSSMNNYRLFRRLKQEKSRPKSVPCSRQFPECPPEKNEECKKCPFYSGGGD